MPLQPSWTAREQRKFKEEYEAGATIQAIAASSRYGYGTVHRMLASAGVQFRPRGIKVAAPKRPRRVTQPAGERGR